MARTLTCPHSFPFFFFRFCMKPLTSKLAFGFYRTTTCCCFIGIVESTLIVCKHRSIQLANNRAQVVLNLS